MIHMIYVLLAPSFDMSIHSYLVERVQVSLVGPECALDSLGTAVAAKLPSDEDRLTRKNLEDLFLARGVQEVETDRRKARPADIRQRSKTELEWKIFFMSTGVKVVKLALNIFRRFNRDNWGRMQLDRLTSP